jgi:hypothetical protein
MPSHVPVVSIVMATYNFERFLARAIESALAQDYPAEALDIVVIDDGSTDSTPQVVRPYLDRVRYIRKPNGGLLTTVNRGLAEARGEFISLLSGDDEFLPHKTRAQVDFLLERPEVGMVYADLEVVDDHGRQMHASLWDAGKLKQVRGRAFGALLTKNVVSGGAMMFRSSLKPLFHPIPETAAWEDWYIALKIATVAEIDYIPEAVYRYRYHGDNMNLGAKGDKFAALLRIEVKFRRSLLAELEPGLVTVEELVSGCAAFNNTVNTLAQMTGEPVESLIEVTDEERRQSRELIAAGDGVFTLVNALALDPWNVDAQTQLSAALSPPALEGVRAFATLAHASELIDAREMLTAYASVFSADDDATLIVFGTTDEVGVLAGVLDRLGIGDDGPDLLAVTQGTPYALAGSVRAVYSRMPQDDVLAGCPRVDDSRVAILRELARDAAVAATTPERQPRP